MNPIAIIEKYYPVDNRLRQLLLRHSRQVADKALACAALHPELQLDTAFVEEAAMLHDIGIFRCDAPEIFCFGDQPYIRHGVLGAELLRNEGFPKHARVCERHTGTGLTQRQIEAQQLPLPHQDFLPETLEEQLICFADKFYSKSHVEKERSVEKARKKLQKFGEDGIRRFDHWCQLFL